MSTLPAETPRSRLLQSLGPLGSWLRMRRHKNGRRLRRQAKKGPEEEEEEDQGEDRGEAERESEEAEGGRAQHRGVQQRDLPPVPNAEEVRQQQRQQQQGEQEEEEEGVLNVTVSMEEMAILPDCNTAFMPDDESEDEGGGGGGGGGGDGGQRGQQQQQQQQQQRAADVGKSLEAVKNCGWYWGPISGEVAERLLSSEPNGSFLLRDSSDDHYIFSLTFKLNSKVRHVRIEHDQGIFSFGSYTKFKSSTIVDFIENAVGHSRSGRYLFFLHRQPRLGPLRVQLLHPVSRFKTVHSLQHQCRFVILQHVPRDLLHRLNLPVKIQEYLNTPHYYSEQVERYSQER